MNFCCASGQAQLIESFAFAGQKKERIYHRTACVWCAVGFQRIGCVEYAWALGFDSFGSPAHSITTYRQRWENIGIFIVDNTLPHPGLLYCHCFGDTLSSVQLPLFPPHGFPG